MKLRFPPWMLGLIGIALLIVVPFLYLQPSRTPRDDPAAGIPSRAEIARRDNVDPIAMQAEIAAERTP